jgi:hypothetical protein
MPVEFSSFISYPHGQGKIIKPFIERLRTELEDRVEPFVDMPPYHDAARLAPGYRYDNALANAICRSLSMVAVYMPQYESSEYCLREFAAMEELERQRLPSLAPHLGPEQGMIFPIVLRKNETRTGQARLPDWITEQRQYSDFSRFQTGIGDIFELPDVILQIEKIVQSIRNLYEAIIELDRDPCDGCDGYTMPTIETIRGRLREPRWNSSFPGRGAPS